MSDSLERLPEIPAERLTPAQREAAEEMAAGRRGGVVGPFVAALRSPECMRRLQHFGAYLRFESALEPRLREMVILLTARRFRQDFEWVTHEATARASGVPAATLEAIRTGTRPASLTGDEATIFEFCDVLFDDGRVPDDLYDRTLALLGEAGVIDAVCTAGYYSTLALIMNVARTALPPGTPPAPWPEGAG